MSNVGIITGNTVSPYNQGDRTWITRLSGTLGHTLSFLNSVSTSPVTADEVATFVASNSLNLVIISSAVTLTDIDGPVFRDLSTPVLHLEGWLYDDEGFCARGDSGETKTTYTQVTIEDESHPITAGLSGDRTVVSTARAMSYIHSDAANLGQIQFLARPKGATAFHCVWCYERGALLADGVTTAAERRAGLHWIYDTGPVTAADGWTLFDQTVGWLLTNPATTVDLSGTFGGLTDLSSLVLAVDDGAVSAPSVVLEAAFGAPWNTAPSEGVGDDRFEFDGLLTYDSASIAPIGAFSLEAGGATVATIAAEGVTALEDDLDCVLLVDPSGFYDAEQRAVLNSSPLSERTALAVGLGTAGCAGPIFHTDKYGEAMWLNQSVSAALMSCPTPTPTTSGVFTVGGVLAERRLVPGWTRFAYTTGGGLDVINFYFKAAGELGIYTPAGNVSAADPYVTLGLADTDRLFWAVEFTASTCAIKISADGVSWTTTASGALSRALVPGTRLYVGASFATAAGIGSKVYEQWMSDGNKDAARLARFLPSMFAAGNRADGDTAVDAHGVTWTIGRPAATTDMPRVMVGGSEQYISLPGVSGEYVSVPDSAANSITGDVAVKAYLPASGMGSNRIPASKWQGGGDQRSWHAGINGSNFPYFAWTTDGTAGTQVTRTSTAAITADVQYVAYWLDVNDGSGNHKVVFYTSTDGVTWTVLSTVTNSGTTSVFDSTTRVAVGAINDGTAVLAAFDFGWMELISGDLNGTLVERIDAAEANANATTWTSSTSGATVTLNKSASAQYHAAVVPPNTTIVQGDGVNDFAQVCGDDTVGDFNRKIGLSLVLDALAANASVSSGWLAGNPDAADFDGIGLRFNGTNPDVYSRLDDGATIASVGDNANNITFNQRFQFIGSHAYADHEAYVDGVSVETATNSATSESSPAAFMFFGIPTGSRTAFDLYGAAVTNRRVSETLTTSRANHGTGAKAIVIEGAGPTAVDGPRHGQTAGRFLGTTGSDEDRFQCSNPGLTGSFTVAWAQRFEAIRGTGTGVRTVFYGDTLSGHGWNMLVDNNGDLTVRGYSGTYPSIVETDHVYSSAFATDGTWNHIAVVYDDTTNVHTAYVDGVPVGSDTYAFGDNPSNVDLRFFSSITADTIEIDIDAAELLLTDVALTATQVAELAATALGNGHYLSTPDLAWGTDLDMRVKVQVDNWPNEPAPLIKQWSDGGAATFSTITLESSSESVSSDKTGVTMVVSAPSGIEDGDLLVFVGAGDVPTTGFTLPAGWTAIVNETSVSSGRDRCLCVGWKIASSESGSYTFGYDAGQERAGAILRFSGVDTSNPFDVTYSAGSHRVDTENDETPPNASITTVSDNAVVLLAGMLSHDDLTALGAPSGYTLGPGKFGDVAYDDAFHRQFFTAYKTVTSAGAESPGSWTHTGNGTNVGDSICVSVALRPATSGETGLRSVRFTLANSDLGFKASADGESALLDFVADPDSVPAYVTDGGAQFWVRVTCDADNGASGSETKFWTRQNDTDTWTQLGVTRTGSVLALYDSAQPITVGASELAGVAILEIEAYNAIDGDLLFSWAASDLTPAVSTFNDPQTNLWTLNNGLLMTEGNDWTDITPYLRHQGFTTSHGRTEDLTSVESGQLNLLLDNRDRRFEPGYTGSPYYPYVRFRTPIRLRATWQGATYDLFRGFVTEWEPQPVSLSKDDVCAVTATDLAGIAAATEIDGGYLSPYITDVALAHFRLQELNGTTAYDSISRTLSGSLTSLTLGDDTFAASGVSVGQYPHKPPAGTFFNPSTIDMGNSGEGAVGFWFRDRGTTTTPAYVVAISNAAETLYTWKIGIESDGGIVVDWTSDGTTAGPVTVAATSDLMDGAWHHCVLSRSGSGTSWKVDAYVDGVSVAADITGPVETPYAGPTTRNAFGEDAICNLGELTVWNQAISEVAVEEVYNAFLDSMPRQTSGQRVATIADYLGIPESVRDIDTGKSVMIPESLNGKNALEAMQDAAVAEYGIVVVCGCGDLGFQDRASRTTSSTLLTVSSAGPQFVGLQWTQPDEYLANIVVGTLGADLDDSVAARDLDSIAAVGPARENIALRLDDRTVAQSYVDHVLAQRTSNEKRVRSMSIIARREWFRDLLPVEVGSRVRVLYTPQGGGDPIDWYGFIEFVAWDVMETVWQLNVRASPQALSIVTF